MFSYVGTVSQAVPVAMLQVVQRHIRTRLNRFECGLPFLPATTTCDPSFDILKELRAPPTSQLMVEKLTDPPPTPEEEKRH